MKTEELPKELRDLIDAVRAWRADDIYDSELVDAIDAYERSQMPQPIEVLMTRWPNYAATDGWGTALALNSTPDAHASRELWRCTITPHERIS